MNEALHKLRRCLEEVGNEELLRAVTVESQIIMTALDQVSDEESSGLLQLCVDGNWLARVCAALASGSAPNSSEECEESESELAREDRLIGNAFVESFVQLSTATVRSLRELTNCLSEVSASLVAAAQECPSYAAVSSHEIDFLKSAALTPLKLYRLMECIALFFRRYLRYRLLAPPIEVSWNSRTLSIGSSDASSELQSEVSTFIEVPKRDAFYLCKWAFEEALRHPLMFDGFLASPTGHNQLSIRALHAGVAQLHKRWTSTAEDYWAELAMGDSKHASAAWDELVKLRSSKLELVARSLRQHSAATSTGTALLRARSESLFEYFLQSLSTQDHADAQVSLMALACLVRDVTELQSLLRSSLARLLRDHWLTKERAQQIEPGLFSVALTVDSEGHRSIEKGLAEVVCATVKSTVADLIGGPSRASRWTALSESRALDLVGS